MRIYAQLDDSGNVIAVVESMTAPEHPHQVDATGQGDVFSLVGLHYDADSNTFASPVLSLPVAHITIKDDTNTERSVFGPGESIAVHVTVRDPSDSVVLTAFSGTFAVPFFDESGRRYYVALTFVSGVAAVTLTAPTLPSGRYSVDARSSTLVRVLPAELVITIN